MHLHAHHVSTGGQDDRPAVPVQHVRNSGRISYFAGRWSHMDTLPESILRHAQSLAEGGVLSPKEFLHLGSRAAVDQAFSRLVKVGRLLRVARGTYVAPIAGRSGMRVPAPEKVLSSMAELSGEMIAPHGASAANLLGLTRQVPARLIYLTSGRTRKLKLGRAEVLVKHAPPWMLALGSRPAGTAVRALVWIGPTRADKALAALRRTLPLSEWHALTTSRSMLPSWLAQAIGRESARG
jgi:hypothetical protein